MTSKQKVQDQTHTSKAKTSTGKGEGTPEKISPKGKTRKTLKGKDDSGRLKELQRDLQEQKEKYLRLSADFDNYRKRTLREKTEMARQAGEEIYLRILPVLDDLERAMKSIQEAKDMEAVKEGMLLIHNKLKDYLAQQGVREIDALHKDFDTDEHEAVTQMPSGDKKLQGKVVDVIEKGYYLNDKVIRFSKVVIGV